MRFQRPLELSKGEVRLIDKAFHRRGPATPNARSRMPLSGSQTGLITPSTTHNTL